MNLIKMVKKILFIEDEEVIISLLKRKLSQAGYEVFVARNGREGLTMMEKLKPNLILLDIIMPELDGFQVLEQMNENKELKKIPVIIISNSGQPVELERARQLGAKDWLIKTEFEPSEVIEKVVKQIGK